MNVLVTGGAGYIGSHTCVELLEHGYGTVIADNLSNSKRQVMTRIEEISGKSVSFYEIDVRDAQALRQIFEQESIDAVIHFAGYKAVGESMKDPLSYYDNNLNAVLTVLQVMREYEVNNFVFSSSATVYGTPDSVPMREDFPFHKTSPYGTTKQMAEQILMDMAQSDVSFNPVILRYFNPVGAHRSGRIGEDPNGIPNNLMPYISQVAVGKQKYLNVFGGDYETKDGTGVRDYIHVMDLAAGHVAALKLFQQDCGLKIFNLGTGVGYSVLDVLHGFERVIGRKIPYHIAPRRPGDIASYYADPRKAEEELGWKASRTLVEMCSDAWNWQRNNPNGYEEE